MRPQLLKSAAIALLLALALASCAKNETDTLRDSNQRLQTQLETVTKERDTYKAKLDGIRQALDGSSATAPDSANPDSSRSGSSTPDTNGDSTALPPAATQPPLTLPAPPALPVPTPPPSSGTALPPSNEAVTKLKAYADNVLTAAQNYKAQNKQEPPTSCQNGYEAGDYKVEDSDNIVQDCSVTIKGDGAYSVTVKDDNGNSVSVP